MREKKEFISVQGQTEKYNLKYFLNDQVTGAFTKDTCGYCARGKHHQATAVPTVYRITHLFLTVLKGHFGIY